MSDQVSHPHKTTDKIIIQVDGKVTNWILKAQNFSLFMSCKYLHVCGLCLSVRDCTVNFM
jgi:hypothetical protein